MHSGTGAAIEIVFKIALSDLTINEPQNLVLSVFFRLGPENTDHFQLVIAYWYYETDLWNIGY